MSELSRSMSELPSKAERHLVQQSLNLGEFAEFLPAVMAVSRVLAHRGCLAWTESVERICGEAFRVLSVCQVHCPALLNVRSTAPGTGAALTILRPSCAAQPVPSSYYITSIHCKGL